MSSPANRTLLKVSCLLTLGAIGVAWQTPRPVEAQGGPAGPTNESRIAALEKAVLQNSERPDSTVLARLERIEKSLKLDDKQAREHAATDAKTFDELKSSVVRAERDQEAIERRLRDIERLKLDRNTADLAGDLRDMRRDLDGLKASLRDMQDRVRRQEQR